MKLPITPRKPLSVNPTSILIYAAPKTGKTSIAAQLPKSLILECEPPGANFVECNSIDLFKASEFNEALLELENCPSGTYDYVIVDTVSRLDEWSEIVGTYNYMDRSQGQKFNREGDLPKGKKIVHTDNRFETVHTLANGSGYQFSREVMIDWYDRLNQLVATGKIKCFVLLAHIKDKFVETKVGNVVETADINLTGKVKSNYCSRVDAVAYMYRKGNQAFLNFNNEHKVAVGGRASHLDGEILISEKIDNQIVTYWSEIFKKV
jgi:hypothetical protein